MSPSVVVAVFLVVAVAELPDKTMIATLMMGSRSRPALVWIGSSAAFLVHVTMAVVVGRLILLLPHRLVEGIVTALFLGGAAYLLLVKEKDAERQGELEAESAGNVADERRWRVVATAFTVILIGEFGDLTQILTINLAARYKEPWAVFVGAWSALVMISALAAFSGRLLLRVLPLQWIRRAGGMVLLGFAGFNLYQVVAG